MEVKHWLFIILALIVILTITFAIIYKVVNGLEVDDWNDAFFLAIQIQSGVGISNLKNKTSINNWVTLQTSLSYFLDILLVTFIGLYIAELVFHNKIK
jgi:hypothetical protein